MKHRFNVLDIFRGIFASLVFLFHLRPFADTPVVNNAFVESCDMFIDFFFVLSGFVIANKYEDLDTAGRLGGFCRKRFLRIYPLHLFMLLLFLGVTLAKQPLSAYIHVNNTQEASNTPLTFLTSLLLLNSIAIPGVHDVSWNVQSWSISAEMIAYLAFGLLVTFINSARLYRQRIWFYAAILVVSLAALIVPRDSLKLNYSFDYGFLRGLIGFFAGVICLNLYRLIRGRWWVYSKTWFSIAECLIIFVIVLVIGQGNELKKFGVFYEPLFFLCILIFAFEKGAISGLLKNIPFLQTTGKYSYSIYLTHTLVISLFNIAFIRVLKFPPSAYAYLFVLNYLAVWLVSSWTYKHVEARFYNKL